MLDSDNRSDVVASGVWRSAAPLRRADDAHLLGPADLSISDAVARAADVIEQALKRVGGHRA